MAHLSAPDRHDESDRGTRLGVGTRVLTAVVAAPLWVIRRLSQISRTTAHLLAGGAGWIVRAIAAVGRPVGMVLSRGARRFALTIVWCARSLRGVLQRCLSVEGPIGVLRRCIDVVFLGLGRVVRDVARLCRWVAAVSTSVLVYITWALATVAHALASAIGALLRPAVQLLHEVARWVAHSLAPLWQLIATLVTRLGHEAARLFGQGVAACVRVARSIAAPLARVGRWIGARAARVLYGINVAIARARAQHALDIDDPTRVEDPPAMQPGDGRLSCTIEVFQNPYLPRSGTTVDVIVTVRAAGFVDTACDVAPERAEVILVDCSGSMGKPWRKIRSARMATAAAIEALPDGTWFAIVRANHDAQVVYPRHGGLARKTPETMIAAHRALRLLWPEGGTAMGRWLVAARELCALRPGAIAHAILLTDGHNEGETPDDLAMAVEGCVGSFQCDCRGVGDDWDVEELHRISSALLGTVDIVREPEELAAEFTAMTELAMGRTVNDVSLRVWTPQGAEVEFVKQVTPGLEDLTARRTDVDDLVGEYPTGAWGEETRDYHVRIRVPTRAIGDRMLAGRAVLMVDGQAAAEGNVLAVWTDDEELSTRLHPDVAHATGQADLADAIHHGLEAFHARDTERATHHLGRAVKLAHEVGDTVRLDHLCTIVDVDDAVTGTVHLRDDPHKIDVMTLDASSTKTVRRTESRLSCAEGQPT
jgi:von Willebrand factor type A C-terminal domain/von Willebrand factor type A domain